MSIAGADTGIGKTHTACALLHVLRTASFADGRMKPVASGCAIRRAVWAMMARAQYR